MRSKVLGLGLVIALAVAALVWRFSPRSAVIATVPLGDFPGAAAIDARSGAAYVPNYMDTTVDVLGNADSHLVRSFTVGSNGGAHPESVLLDGTLHRVFILADDGSLSVFDSADGALLRRVSLGGTDLSAALDARRARLFVANADAATVSVVDARTGAVVRTAPTGAFPQVVATDEATGRVFVADHGDNTVTVLDAATGGIIHHTQLTAPPETLLVTPSLGEVFIASADDQRHLDVLDARSGALLRALALHGPNEPNVPPRLAFDPRTRHLFVAQRAQVRMLDARSGRLLHITRLDSDVTALAADGPDGLCLALTQGPLDAEQRFSGHGWLVALDARTGAVRGRVGVGVGPRYLALDPRRRQVLVVNSNVNPDGSLAAPVRTDDWWTQHLPWLRGVLPSPVQARDGHGSVTVIDTSRL